MIVDDGKEFYGDTTKLMEKHDVIIQRGDPSQHRSQGIVERFNRTLADRLFTYQYHKELEDPPKSNNKKRSHTQLDSRKQVIAFQDRVITINIKEAQHPLK